MKSSALVQTVRHITLVQTLQNLEVSGAKRIALKSRIPSRFSVQSGSVPKVTEVYVLLSSWCQDPSSGREPSGSICPWPHRTELGTAQEKQRWASFLKMRKSTEALDPHARAFSTLVTSSKVTACYFPESMKTWRNVSNTRHQWWVSQNKYKNVQAKFCVCVWVCGWKMLLWLEGFIHLADFMQQQQCFPAPAHTPVV